MARPASVLNNSLVGQAMAGASRSWTVTVNWHWAALPLLSVAVQVTSVTPNAKVEPLAGTHTKLVTARLSLALAV